MSNFFKGASFVIQILILMIIFTGTYKLGTIHYQAETASVWTKAILAGLTFAWMYFIFKK